MARRRGRGLPEPPAQALPIFEGAPWYVKLVIWLLVWFGFPVVMCVVLFALIIGYLPSPITETSEMMRQHRREMGDVLEYVKIATRIQRQVCRNTSSNPAERVECDR